ncbi:CsbD family protein [Herbiconiux sp. SYSU D00978]|uniref:CsbD family protein n=1 Tax=Herbiconiux sp. SYSU D00978 TaxID=2812562 RepID=UPI001A97A17D|nr:CsbD family protein [Herbiconiux sp. SYSU D00978]
MGTDDKAQNTGEKLGGQAKEAWGNLTNDPDTKAEGQAQQDKADLKQAGEKIKDVFKG